MAYFKNPQAFYNTTYGNRYDMDGFYDAQCWDYKAYFVKMEGLNVNTHCSITGYAGDLYKLRYEKGYDKYFEFFYPKHAKRGDWIYWDRHVAMVWDVDIQHDTVTCLGQNQGGVKRVTLKDYKLSTALGCMRYIPWIEEEKEAEMLYGIDISNWQSSIDLESVLKQTKTSFVIAKATEGTNFTDIYCDRFIAKALNAGKLVGFYHFARPEKNSSEDEARFFYEKSKGYFGKGIPILDWESSGKADVAWAKRWLDDIYKRTGVKPMIYMSESVVNAYDWSSVSKAGYPLWVAKYRDNNPDYNYDMSNAGSKPSIKHWSSYTMWQWTSTGKLSGYSGNLDCNVFYGDEALWKKYSAKEKSGWQKIEGKWYYYAKGGYLKGWQYLKWSKGSDWFYFGKDGAMLENGLYWIKWSQGYGWFMFDANGAMIRGTKNCSFIFDKNGCLIGGKLNG